MAAKLDPTEIRYLPLFSLLLLPLLVSSQQNIQISFPSIPTPAFVNPPPPASPPPTALSPPPVSQVPSSSPIIVYQSRASRHDITVAVVSTAFTSFAISGLLFFLFQFVYLKKKQTHSPPPVERVSDRKSSGRMQRLHEEKMKKNIVDESGLDAIYIREFDKVNGSHPQSVQSRRSTDQSSSDGEREEKKRPKKHRKDREPLIPPGSLDSTSTSFLDSIGSSSSMDQIFPPTYVSSMAPPSRIDNEVVITEVSAVPKQKITHLPPPPGRQSPLSKPPLHPVSHLSPPSLLQPQLPLPPSRFSNMSQQAQPVLPPLISLDPEPPIRATPPPIASTTASPSRAPGPPPPPPPTAPRPPSAGPPPPPPPAGRGRGGPPPPPPPGGRGGPPPPPPPGGRGGPPPPPPGGRGGPPGPPSSRPPASPGGPSGPTGPKLKPLHWEVMRKLNPDQSMVWDRFKEGGSFRFDEDTMEALFATGLPTQPKAAQTAESSSTATPAAPAAQPQICLLDKRKSQNIAIVLRSLPATKKDVIDALLDGRGDLNADTLEKLERLGVSKDEQKLIKDFSGDPSRLADAELFLYDLLQSVPSPFERVDAMLFRATYGHEVDTVRQSLETLEVACKELRGSSLFLKLLEAVLKAGNRMNAGTTRGNAQAFNLTSLRKLSEVKSTDKSTTLLHFIIEEVVRTEGKRSTLNRSFSHLRRTSSIASSKSGEDGSGAASAAREERHKEYMKLGLPIVGGLSSEMTNVKSASVIDYDTLTAALRALGDRLKKIKKFLDSSGGGEFVIEMQGFVDTAEEEITKVEAQQVRVLELVKRTSEYYNGGGTKEKGAQQLQVFMIVKDFLGMVDNACADIQKKQQMQLQQKQLQEKKKLAEALGNVVVESSEGGSSKGGRKDAFDENAKKDAAERSGRRGAGVDNVGRRITPRFPNLPAHFMSENSKSDSSSDED